MPVATDSSLLQGTTRFPAHGTVGRRVEQAIEFLDRVLVDGPRGPGLYRVSAVLLAHLAHQSPPGTQLNLDVMPSRY